MDFRDPTTRWTLGVLSGALIAAIGILFTEGTLRLLILGLAVFDAVTTPQFLKHAVQD